MILTATVLKPLLSGSGYAGLPPGTVPGMRQCGITRHWDCLLTVVVICLRARPAAGLQRRGRAGVLLAYAMDAARGPCALQPVRTALPKKLH